MKRPGKRTSYVLTASLVLVIGVLTGVWLLWSRWTNSPVNGTVHTTGAVPVAPALPTYQALKAAYFSTQVPATWRIQPHTTNSSTKIQILAFATRNSSAQVAITSDILPSDGLPGVADYHLRTSDPATYARYTSPILQTGDTAFTAATDSSEITVFRTNAGRYVSIAISNTGSQQSSIALLKVLFAKWTWV